MESLWRKLPENKQKKIITAAPVIKKAVLADSEIKEDLFFD
jgi:hypothetical protein